MPHYIDNVVVDNDRGPGVIKITSNYPDNCREVGFLATNTLHGQTMLKVFAELGWDVFELFVKPLFLLAAHFIKTDGNYNIISWT